MKFREPTEAERTERVGRTQPAYDDLAAYLRQRSEAFVEMDTPTESTRVSLQRAMRSRGVKTSTSLRSTGIYVKVRA